MPNQNLINEKDEWPVLIILSVLGLILSFTPGMLLMGIINAAGSFQLETGQMWTFAISISILLFLVVACKIRNLKTSVTLYALCSVFILAIMALSHWGFKLQFRAVFFSYFFG